MKVRDVKRRKQRNRVITLAEANVWARLIGQRHLYTYPHERLDWTKFAFYRQKEPV